MFLLTRGGQANFFLGPQISNQQIPELIPQLHIRKFLRYAGPKIANPQIFINHLQIANPQIAKKYCTTLSQSSPKSHLLI